MRGVLIVGHNYLPIRHGLLVNLHGLHSVLPFQLSTQAHRANGALTMHTILIVVHDYPPIISTGSQRVLKFARYLPDFGYRPLILTTGRYGGLPSDEEMGVYRANDLVHSLFSPLRTRRAGENRPGAAVPRRHRGERQPSRPPARPGDDPRHQAGLAHACRARGTARHRRAAAGPHLQQLAARDDPPDRGPA